MSILISILRKVEHIMATQEEIKASLASLEAAVATLAPALAAEKEHIAAAAAAQKAADDAANAEFLDTVKGPIDAATATIIAATPVAPAPPAA